MVSCVERERSSPRRGGAAPPSGRPGGFWGRAPLFPGPPPPLLDTGEDNPGPGGAGRPPPAARSGISGDGLRLRLAVPARLPEREENPAGDEGEGDAERDRRIQLAVEVVPEDLGADEDEHDREGVFQILEPVH